MLEDRRRNGQVFSFFKTSFLLFGGRWIRIKTKIKRGVPPSSYTVSKLNTHNHRQKGSLKVSIEPQWQCERVTPLWVVLNVVSCGDGRLSSSSLTLVVAERRGGWQCSLTAGGRLPRCEIESDRGLVVREGSPICHTLVAWAMVVGLGWISFERFLWLPDSNPTQKPYALNRLN